VLLLINWSGSVTFTPAAFEQARSIEELQSLVRRGAALKTNVRAIGAGHSFTPIAATDGMLISLDALSGIESIDVERREATIFAGTKLYDLGPALAARGWSMENLGDINKQSLAGAISTGTHGTGRRLGNISSQVTGFELVTADGSTLWCDAHENAAIFAAGRVALGTLGIISRLRLRIEPLMNLHLKRACLPVEDCLAVADELSERHRSFEFFWFPYSGHVATKAWDVTQDPPNVSAIARYLDGVLVENGIFSIATHAAWAVPAIVPPLNRLSARIFGSGSQIDTAHASLATQRLVRFNEMEYALPARYGAAALRQLIALVEAQRIHVFFPVEYRWVCADDIWLSPAFERDIVTISIHQLKGMPYAGYFQAAEAIFRRYGGRPHWGKMHYLKAAQLRELYPRWEDFARLRAELDPGGLFLTPYLRTLFI
jgi:FAD-linked oxidoreductase